MIKSFALMMVFALSLSSCAKKKTTEKNITKRQTVAEAKAQAEKQQAEANAKAELEAKMKAEEEAKAKVKSNEPITSDPKKEETVIPAPVASVPAEQTAATTTGSMPPEVAQKINDEKKKALQKLTEQAQAAEKSDLNNAKPGSAEADWVKVIEFILDNGKLDSAQGMEQFMSLDDYSSTNKDEPYNRKMISLVGGVDSKGQFGFSRIHATDEDWSKDEKGNRVGHIYLFLLGRDGTLARSWYKKLVKDSSETERVLEDKYLDLSDADAKARWEKSREYWVKKVVRNK